MAYRKDVSIDDVTGAARQAAREVVTVVKPKLRGWLHAGAFPVAVVGGIVLVALAPSATAKITAAVYSITAALLFGTSALYHRGTWSPRARQLLRRMDHSNIFLIIAGTYTPFAALLLPEGRARLLLFIIWAGALGGVLFRVFWVGAPRWLYTPVYLALGWVAVLYLPDFLREGGVALITLMIVGGVLYSLGGVVYGLKRPDPSPRWFGFHEIFHACTIAAFVVHYIAVSFAVYASPTT
ncbi:MAG: PAQR family membrane homeostasis protein TrhA [Actinomycetota bacterium]